MNLETALDPLFQRFDSNSTPGYSVAVRHKGVVVYQKASGMASLEYGIRNTPQTVFHVASISKQFTAFCVLLLEEEGRLSIDDDVAKYVADVPKLPKPITIRHLLHHTSGIREQWDLFTLSGATMEDLATTEQVLRFFSKQRGINFLPGEEYSYCNTGYTILGRIVKKVSGKPLREFADERVFKPLGMERTYYRDNHGEINFNRASSYGLDKDGDSFKNIALTFDIHGSTSLNTTTGDLLKWIENMNSPQAYPASVVDRLFEIYTLNNGETIDYRRGIKSYTYRGTSVREHTGANAGYRSALLSMPELELDVVVLSNYAHSYPLVKAYNIVDIIAGKELEPKEKPNWSPDPARYESLREGLYSARTFSRCTIRKNEGSIEFEQDGARWLYIHCSGNEYGCAESGNFLYLQEDGSIALKSGVNTSTYAYTNKLVPSEEEIEKMPGMYYSPELQTIYELRFSDDDLVLTHLRRGEIRFIKTTPTTFLSIEGGNLGLEKKEKNGEPRFLLSTDRSRNIEFFPMKTQFSGYED